MGLGRLHGVSADNRNTALIPASRVLSAEARTRFSGWRGRRPEAAPVRPAPARADCRSMRVVRGLRAGRARFRLQARSLECKLRRELVYHCEREPALTGTWGPRPSMPFHQTAMACTT